jgi:hypothetical protein
MQSYFIILSTAPPHNKHQLVEGSPALSFNGQTFRIPTTSKTAGNLTSTLHDAHTLTQTTLQYRVLQLPRSKTVISRTAIDGVPFFFFGIYSTYMIPPIKSLKSSKSEIHMQLHFNKSDKERASIDAFVLYYWES